MTELVLLFSFPLNPPCMWWNVANFKQMNKKECTPHAPIRSASTCRDIYTPEVAQIEFSLLLKGDSHCLNTADMNLGDTTFFLNITKYVFTFFFFFYKIVYFK